MESKGKLMFVMLVALAVDLCCGSYGDKVRLEDVKVLTLRHGQMTTGRRSSPVQQLHCTGGTAGCNEFHPKVVQCHNKGSDGYDIQWECKSDMDNAYRFGDIDVSCEGYDYADDPYILKGSCGLRYTLDLTKEGHQQQKQHSYYGNQQYGGGDQSSNRQSSSSFGNIIFLVLVGGIIYIVYSKCIAPQNVTRQNPSAPPQEPYSGEQPPPYGFRPDYTPGSQDSCSSNYASAGAGPSTFGASRNTGTGGGFWTGAATGGMLGYLFGNRNSGYNNYYQQPYGGYRQPRPSFWSGWSSGYSSGPSHNTSTFGGGSSRSSGTRTASGFGGTSRR